MRRLALSGALLSLTLGAAQAQELERVRLPLPRPPADAKRGPYPIARLLAASDGGLLFVVRRDAGHPFAYALIDAEGRGGRVLWQGADACCAGPLPWSVLLAPRGKEAALSFPTAKTPPGYRLVRRRLPLPELAGGAWAADGSWLGGSMGAFAADGKRLTGPLQAPQEVNDLLFAPGPTPDTLRFVRSGVRYRWDGREAPSREGAWPCDRASAGRDLGGGAPLRFSPDGRFVAWSPRGAPERVLLCDSRDGRELSLGGAVTAVDFLSAATVVYTSGGRLRQRALPGGPEQPFALPPRAGANQGAKEPAAEEITAVAAAPSAGLLFIGNREGEVYRVNAR